MNITKTGKRERGVRGKERWMAAPLIET